MKKYLLGNAIQTPRTLLTLIRNVKRQKQFLQQTLGDELESAKKIKDAGLDETDFKKITNYYGLAVPAILGEALCTLRGEKMSMQERMALTYQGAMTGLFDDFFDKHNITDEKIKIFMERPQDLSGDSSSERLFLGFYKKALQYAHDPQLMLHYLRQVYDVQVESKKQASPGLTKDEIKRITIHKGAVSVLFYRSVLVNPLTKEEEDALYRVGGLMQLGNDIFDVYKDSQQKIETLMTTAKKVNDVRVIFSEMTETSFNAVYKTGYAPKNIKRFLRLISMSLCSRCYTCFDQLEKKERLTNNMFSSHQYSRKDLVCDMDKPGNKWKSVIYHIKHEIK